ncbi:MAG TPA: ATP-binding protein [Geomonas sp.]
MLQRVLNQYNEAIMDTDRDRALLVVRDALGMGISPEEVVFEIVVPAIELMMKSISENQGEVPFKVQEMVEKTVSLIDESFRQLQIVITVTAADEPVITGHPNEFSQVILNILFNARDAFLARKDDKPRVIAIEIFGQGGRGVITIADNAGGIPEEILEKIFDPYFTTRGPDQGIGIGLYMSKIIIEKNMPGRLSARNTAEGAEFRIEV